jgi:hypothetical protein
MIEDAYNVKLDPREVFFLEDVTDEQIVELMQELNVSGFHTMEGFKERTESGLRTDLYIPFAVYHGYKLGLRDLNLFSYAGLISGYITGMFGGFGTDTYKNERIIENKAFDEMNRIRQAKVTPLQEAILIDLFMLDHYLKLSEDAFVRKSVSLPKSLVEKISQEEGDSFSGKLQNVLYKYFAD